MRAHAIRNAYFKKTWKANKTEFSIVGSVLPFIFYDPLSKTQMFAKTRLAEGRKLGVFFLLGGRLVKSDIL